MGRTPSTNCDSLQSIRIDDTIRNTRDLTKPKGAILLASNDDSAIVINVDGAVINEVCAAWNFYFADSFPDKTEMNANQIFKKMDGTVVRLPTPYWTLVMKNLTTK